MYRDAKQLVLDVLGVVTEDMGVSEIITKTTGRPVSMASNNGFGQIN